MSEWVSLVYVGPHQVLPVFVALVLWLGLAGLGYLITPRGRIVEANAFVGWGTVSTVFTLVGVVAERPFFILTILAGIGALLGIALSVRRREPLFVAGSWRIVVLALPLLLIAGAMAPSQWDEFSHWLPAPKYLLAYDGFPTGERPYAGPFMFPAYPYAWPFLIYLSARIAGGFLDNIGGILNVLMLLNFAGFAVRTGFAAVARPRAPIIGWPLAVGIVLTATLLNPTFVQKIVLTTYSDVASSVAIGVALLALYELLSAVRENRSVAPAAWTFAWLLALLVNVRQPNIVVAASIVLAMGIIAWRDKDIAVRPFLRLFVLLLVPAIIVYAAWRWYVSVEFARLGDAEAGIQALSSWNIALIPTILASMASVALKKVAFFGPMIVATGFAVRALLKGVKSDFDRLSLLTASVFVAYNAFLFFTYVAHFGAEPAASAVSYWRYNIDIGAVATIFLIVAVLMLTPRLKRLDGHVRWAAPAAAVLILLLPLALASKIRFDLEPPKPYFTRVAKEIATLGLSDTMYLLDPTGTGEAGVITRVYMNVRDVPWLSAFQDKSSAGIARFVGSIAPDKFLLIHSIAPGVSEALGRTLDPRHSYLFRRASNGWVLVREWLKPADHPW